jgi:asparagine synthase (glutamine-hydrolysing)
MCGILGIGSANPVEKREWLANCRDMMIHRGPNDAGEWWSEDGRVGLGHRRLSILDLSLTGHQPMRFQELGLAIVFNGEIYNYQDLKRELSEGNRWVGNSDTEVLLAAYAKWGTDCLEHLNGMFAFAIYDEGKRQLFLARDRAGEKPLFYQTESGKLYFASELKALMAVPDSRRKIDPLALDCYLAFGYVPGEMCILEGYRKLQPAHALTFNLEFGTHRIWRWWTPPVLVEGGREEMEEENLVEQLETLLEDAVKKQIVADVPVGILLSGGVDSSLVTAMAVRKAKKVKTFTIGFPGAGRLDETRHARLIASHFGTEHTEMMAEQATADLIPLLAKQFDEPIADSSIIPTYLVSRLVRQHCTVALGGDGGDELFGGYAHYSRLLWIQRSLGFIPRYIRHLVAHSSGQILPLGLKGRNYLQGLDVDLERGLPTIASYFDRTSRKRLITDPSKIKVVAENVWKSRIPFQKDLLRRATQMDFENYLPEDILVKVDRASMLNSLEVRAPFLDYRILEFAFGKVPSRLKASTSEKKILPKKLAKRLLPSKFDIQRKQGFSIPLANWLKAGQFRSLFCDTLTNKNCLFNTFAVRNLIENQDRGLRNGERLFALVVFELWRREYQVSL